MPGDPDVFLLFHMRRKAQGDGSSAAAPAGLGAPCRRRDGTIAGAFGFRRGLFPDAPRICRR
ncbi:MAG: hypothetical protein CW342_11865 [Thermoactinomycetaceae bacterium]|nr:hypothetical protein [Thermoactinomycetaceae bacterium]